MKQIFNRAQQSIWSNEDKWHQTLLGGTSPPSLIYLTNLVHWARLQAGTPRLFLAAKFVTCTSWCLSCGAPAKVKGKASWQRGSSPFATPKLPSPPDRNSTTSSEVVVASFVWNNCSFIHNQVFTISRNGWLFFSSFYHIFIIADDGIMLPD